MSTATQVKFPWKAVLRTVVAGAIAFGAVVPTLISSGDVSQYPGVGIALVITGGLTRVLAVPAVEAVLLKYAPWLAAGSLKELEVSIGRDLKTVSDITSVLKTKKSA